MKRLTLSLSLILFLVATGRAVEPTSFPFRDGDQPIVFIGDSITEQRQYTTMIEAFLLTRFPDWKITFRNSGWSGDTMTFRTRGGFESGYKRDIQPLKPALALINFGMNDARVGTSAIPAYAEAAVKMIAALTNDGARVVLLTPSPEERYEPGQPGGSAYNELLRQFAGALTKVSDQTGIPLVNQLDPFITCIESGRRAGVLGAADAPRLIPDAVHPNPAGHFIMAASILKGLKAPALVSRLAIDAVKGAVTTAEGCTATIDKAGDAWAVTRTDDRLPWGIPEESRITLAIPGFTPLTDLNLYTLAVTGLPAGTYQLMSETNKLGSWSAVELAAGINLSTSPCPVVAQALALHAQVAAKNNLVYEKWRGVQLGGRIPEWLTRTLPAGMLESARDAELLRLEAEIIKAEARINELRRPKPWTLIIKPAG
jgi:lysophospholipase L1-like esterase